jgi:hypothetical protein
MPISFDITIAGTPDAFDQEAALLIIGRENTKRTAAAWGWHRVSC